MVALRCKPTPAGLAVAMTEVSLVRRSASFLEPGDTSVSFEDNAVNQVLAVRLLEKRGHTTAVSDVKTAVAALETETTRARPALLALRNAGYGAPISANRASSAD